MTVIMSLNCSVSSLILKISFRRYQHGSHHCKRTECGRNHITHNISIIVLAGPDKSTFCLHNTGYDIIDQTVEVSQAGFFKFIFKLCLKDLLENLFKSSIVCLGNGILASEPYILFGIQCIIKAASCKALYGIIQVVHAAENTCSVKMLDQFFTLFSVLALKYEICISRFVNIKFCIFIDVTICMTCKCDRFHPVLYTWLNSFYYNRSAEYGSIKNSTDRSIRTLVHFFQIILFHSGCIRCDGSTFYCNSVFLGCFCRINRHLIICLVSVFKAKIIILCIQFQIWCEKFVFDDLPQNTCHFVSIHLN